MEGALARALAGQLFMDPVIMKIIMLIIILLGVERLISLIVAWRKNKKRNGEGDDRTKWKDIVEGLKVEIGNLGSTLESIHTDLKLVKDDTQWTRCIHDKYDDEGRPIWYSNTRTLEKTIGKLTESIDKQSVVLTGMWNEIKDSRRDIDKVHGEMRNLHRRMIK